jgi:hypothetical protein
MFCRPVWKAGELTPNQPQNRHKPHRNTERTMELDGKSPRNGKTMHQEGCRENAENKENRQPMRRPENWIETGGATALSAVF